MAEHSIETWHDEQQLFAEQGDHGWVYTYCIERCTNDGCDYSIETTKNVTVEEHIIEDGITVTIGRCARGKEVMIPE